MVHKYDHPLIDSNYDLISACWDNRILCTDIIKCILEITGEYEGPAWHWLVETKTDFAYITGKCSYKGAFSEWSMQSSVKRFDADTIVGALDLVPRKIFERLVDEGKSRVPSRKLVKDYF